MKKVRWLFMFVALILCMSITLTACGGNNTTTPPTGDEYGTQYIVTFDSQGGSAVESQKVDSGSHLNVPTNPTKDNYYFDGWYVSTDANAKEWNFDTDTVTATTTLYAKWLAYITVTFDAHNGEAVTTQSVPEGKFATRPTMPQRDNYDFIGWYKGEADDSEAWDFDSDTVKEPITLHAHWQLQSVTPSYEVEAPGAGPQSASNITSVGGVPLLTLNNGVQMPQFGLGTQIQSLENGDLGVLNQTSREAVAAALRAGYRHLDDAHGYLQERGVGQGIKDSGVLREEIWITDKLWPSEYANAAQAIDDMLDRLDVEYIDLLYLHHPAGTIANIESAWRAMEAAYGAGKIRALGISNFDNRMEAFNAIMDEKIKPQVMQIECHPLAQRVEARALATQYNIQVECWYPLKHNAPGLVTSNVLDTIAETHNKSVYQIIIRWHIQEGFSVIPGSTNPAHIQENIDVFDFKLTEAEMNSIRSMDQGESGRSFRMSYGNSLSFFGNPPREWNGTFEAAAPAYVEAT